MIAFLVWRPILKKRSFYSAMVIDSASWCVHEVGIQFQSPLFLQLQPAVSILFQYSTDRGTYTLPLTFYNK